MARPLSVTDDQILDATQAVWEQLGPHGLTMSEIAREVGLSRAAISLRFGSLDDLKRRLVQRMAVSFEERLGEIRLDPGAAGLIAFARMLGTMMRSREQFKNFMLRYNAGLHDPILLELENRRSAALQALVTGVMPETAIDKTAAVDAFLAQMTGSMMNWQTMHHPDAAEFLMERTVNWIRLAGIPYDDDSKNGTSR